MRRASSRGSILRVGLSRSSLKCFTSEAGFSAIYLRFVAKSSMHFKHSSSRLTVAPFTVWLGLRFDGCCRRSSRYASTIATVMLSSLRSPKNNFRLVKDERWPLTVFSVSPAKCERSNSSHNSRNVIRSPVQPTLNSPIAISPSLRFQIFLASSLLVVLVDSKYRSSFIVYVIHQKREACL